MEYPKKDPITGRMVCESCWSGIHWHRWSRRVKDAKGNFVDVFEALPNQNLKGAESACNGECDCHHLSEEQTAGEELKKLKENRKLKKELSQSLLESSPLRAVNPEWRPHVKGQ